VRLQICSSLVSELQKINNSNIRWKKSYPEYTKAGVLEPPEELTARKNLQMHNVFGRTGEY
jgi:hypothetical protein